MASFGDTLNKLKEDPGHVTYGSISIALANRDVRWPIPRNAMHDSNGVILSLPL